MKKIFKLMMATAVALATFTACEDVPEPYNNPYAQRQGQGGGEEPVVIEPTGSGTQADPWNVAALIEACNGLAADAFLNDSKDVYVTGIVTETTDVSAQYGNATYYISDDAKGSNRFYVYRGKLLDGASVTADTDLQVGDSVVVCGKVKNYKGNTLEFDQGNYLVFHKKGEGGPTLDTPGTADAPLTVAQALDYINNKLGTATSPEGYVKGKIVAVGEIDTGQYGNATYTISDDGTDAVTLQIYRGYSLGGEKFKSADEIKVGDEVVVKGKLVNFKGNTPQFAQGSAIYSLNGKTSGGGDNPTTTTTVGTKDAPKSVAEALTAINAMADGATSSEFWFVKGKVVKVTTNQTNFDTYGNLNYLISDDGTESNTITVYSGDGLDGAKFSGIDALKPGDEVIVYGNLQRYVNKSGAMTPEIAKGNYLVSLKSGSTTPVTPSTEAKGDGSLNNPFNAIAATNLALTLADKEVTTESYYIYGKVASVKYAFDAEHGTATFFISEDGSSNNTFQIYSTYYFNNAAWKDGNQQIKVGDDVIIYGQLTNYGGTPETASKKSCIYSLNGKTSDEGGGDNPGGDVTPGGDVSGNSITVVYGDLGISDLTNPITLSDGTILTFAKEDGSNAPVYHEGTKIVRMYARNSVTITAGSKTIASVVFAYDTYNGVAYKGNDELYGVAGSNTITPTKDDKNVTFANVNNSTLKVVNAFSEKPSGGTQFRCTGLTITYAN